MNILITGGAGFLGSHISSYYAQRRHKVTVVDNLSTSRIDSLKNIKVNFIKKKIGQISADEIVRAGHDLILHLAANAYIPSSVSKPYHDFTNNLAQTVKLLETLRRLENRPKIVLFSSAAVLGNNNGIMKETDPVNPLSPYGASKAGVEFYGKNYADNYGMEILVLRLFPLYGPGQKKQIVYDLMKKVTSQEKNLEVIGTGKEERDFTFVRDAVDAIATLCEKNIFNGKLINLCSGKRISTHAVARQILKVSGSNKAITFTDTLRKGDVPCMTGSIALLSKYWNPVRTDFQEGIQNTWEWFKNENYRKK